MTCVQFSLIGYQNLMGSGDLLTPSRLRPYFDVDRVKFEQLRKQHGTSKNGLCRAFRELARRTGRVYHRQTYPLQSETLAFSVKAFPAYRFVLPEVMTEDWLAVVDWHKFQRDHVLHQPLTGYVVLKLLEMPIVCGTGDGIVHRTLLDACVDEVLEGKELEYLRRWLHRCGVRSGSFLLNPCLPIARRFWRRLFTEAAYLAAVFHDLGYPWQYNGLMWSKLDYLSAPGIRGPMNARDVVRAYRHRLVYYALSGYQDPDPASPSDWEERLVELTKQAIRETHGFCGAINFLFLNDSVRRFPDAVPMPFYLLCVEWAATAIMMHDMCKVYWSSGKEPTTPQNSFLRIRFEKDPLSAIVTLADLLQDFSRPAGMFHPHQECSTLKYPRACQWTECEVNGEAMMLKYKMANSADLALKRKLLPKECHDYFDSRLGYLDLSALGIRTVGMVAY